MDTSKLAKGAVVLHTDPEIHYEGEWVHDNVYHDDVSGQSGTYSSTIDTNASITFVSLSLICSWLITDANLVDNLDVHRYVLLTAFYWLSQSVDCSTGNYLHVVGIQKLTRGSALYTVLR